MEEDADMSKEEENLSISISKDMAKALVQIARGIEPKYLQPPLGRNTHYESSCSRQNPYLAILLWAFLLSAWFAQWVYFNFERGSRRSYSINVTNTGTIIACLLKGRDCSKQYDFNIKRALILEDIQISFIIT